MYCCSNVDINLPLSFIHRSPCKAGRNLFNGEVNSHEVRVYLCFFGGSYF